MCRRPNQKSSSTESIMEGGKCQENRTGFSSKQKSFSMEGVKFRENRTGVTLKSSNLLEFAAADDVSAFKSEIEERKICLDDSSFWYGRRNGRAKMGFEERTPLMIASLYGSIWVMKYMVDSKKVDVNRATGSDGATALHCAAAGGSPTSVEAVKLLLDADADVDAADADGNRPGDLIARGVKPATRRSLEMLLMGFTTEPVLPKKEYPVDASLPDINTGVYGTDDFRMYLFKVKPCSRAYTHDWTECPFVHPGENARRRDPRKYTYSCVPCPEFRRGACVKDDGCEYAHGVFESWLHPAQYRTRLCKDETDCVRKVCFFAHKVEELRPLYASTGSAMPEPKIELGSINPLGPGSNPPGFTPRSRLNTVLNARDDGSSNNLYKNRFGELKPKNLDDVFGSFDPSILSRSQIFSPKMQSPNGRERSHLSPRPSNHVAQAVMNSRYGAFAPQRSQSFIDRGSMGSSHRWSNHSPKWGSPDGKLEWGFDGEEANKLRKSASFGFRRGNDAPLNANHEPDVSCVGVGLYGSPEKQRFGGGEGGGGGGREELPQWVEQMYLENEQLVA